MNKHFLFYFALMLMAISTVIFGHTLTGAIWYDPQVEMATASTDAGASPDATAVTEASSTPPAAQDASSPSDELLIPNRATAPVPRVAAVPIVFSLVPNHPARLLIPSLNIAAHVQEVGVTPKGGMGTPNNFTDVAWYKFGTIPGDVGSAVIDGHVDNGLALAGVFKHLVDARKGDDIYIITNEGTKIHFIVSDIQLYDYQSVPADQIFNAKDGTRLRLITCGGSWVPGEKTYDQRIVVTAEVAR